MELPVRFRRFGYASCYTFRNRFGNKITVSSGRQFGLLEGQGNIRLRDTWLAVIPVVIYACVYLPMVVLLQGWPDFYGFNRGGMWYVSAPAMLAASYIIGLLLAALQRIRPIQIALHD